MKRVLSILAVLLIAAAVAFGVPTLAGKPWSIDHFYIRVFAEYMLRHPMVLTSLGIAEDLPFAPHVSRLDDFSREFTRRESRRGVENLATLRSYDVTRMTRDQKLSRDVLEYFIADAVAFQPYLFHDYPLNQLFGAQSGLPDFMITLQPLRKESDARHYVERVRRIERAMDQVTEGVRYRAAHGVVPPRFVLDRVVTEMKAFAGHPPRENPLYTHFDGRIDSLKGVEAKPAARLRSELATAIETHVVPAYRRAIALCDSLLLTATTDDGVWKLPDGDAFYDQCLRHHTTSALSADSLHALGLSEVGRIRAIMGGILRRQGIRTPDLGAALTALGKEPRFLYPDEDASREAILADYTRILADVDSALVDPMFGTRPRAPLQVQRVPPFKEATSPLAYYNPPAMDGSRAGVFFANLRDPHETVRFDMRTLAFHEGVPGHHFQIALAQEMRNVAFFRTVIPFTAYSEGWALYAERLCLEQGLQRTPQDSLGALRAELLRAARLVVDTGIHRKRWTREQAIQYMVDQGCQQGSASVTEVERYIVAPGQACAYKVGQLTILGLRERARAELGERFDIRRFHDAVLLNGALPLTVLERVIDEWIAGEKRAAERPA